MGDEGIPLITVLEDALYNPLLFSLQGSSEADNKTESNAQSEGANFHVFTNCH